MFQINSTDLNISFLLVDPAPLAPFRCPINIATTMTATKMIPTVPNVDARAAVEIPCTGAGVSATAVVVGISGCNGITYFRFPTSGISYYFRFKPLPICPSPKMIRTQLISLIIFLEYSRYRNFYPDNNDDVTMTSL